MNYFQNIQLFSNLTELDQQNLSDFCQIQTLKAGQVLFSQGDDAQALYIIASGTLEVIQDSVIIAHLNTGDIVGEMSFFGHPPIRNASVIASQETKIITLLHYSIMQVFQKYPEIHAQLEAIIETRRNPKV